MGKVLGGGITEGDDIAKETRVCDTLFFVPVSREDAMGVGVPSLSLHSHERAVGVEHVKTTRVFVVEGDGSPRL